MQTGSQFTNSPTLPSRAAAQTPLHKMYTFVYRTFIKFILFCRGLARNASDKFARSGLTASKAETVDAPVINEFPICLECRFIEYQNNEYGCGVIGKVVNVTADESVMVDGKIDMSKVNAIAFDPYTHGYYKVTERVGEAFRDGLKLKK